MEINRMVLDKATEALGGDSKPKGPKHGMRSTHIDHHTDGSHTVRHARHMTEKMTEEPELSYAVKDTPELQAKIKQYLGGGEAAEEAAEGGKDSPAEESAEKI